MTDSRKIMLVAIGYWIVVSALCCWLYPLMMSDATARYAPMADHFAAGDWALAFHPKFGVLFQVLSGSICWVLGVSGDKAVQIAAIGLLALSAVPLFFLMRKVFGAEIAWWAVALLLVSDDFTRNSFDGLRESGKCLGFALLGGGAVLRKSGWYALGLFVLITLTSYGFAVASVAVFGWMVCFLWTRDFRQLPLPILGWALGTAAVVVLTHAFTGHWLPSPHYIKFLGGWL